ncbi:MAG: TlpA family protein disulfide reductase [Chloracidobacterium sp.]|nr:TlpA family protein disulfide reductase [Chloracidobacterium sp.]MDW8218333.1 TlpA disulfide reductase family protein [Acidobacteriota bacterium]
MLMSSVAASLPVRVPVVRPPLSRTALTVVCAMMCLMWCEATVAHAMSLLNDQDKVAEEAKKLLAKVAETHKGLASYRATLQLGSSVFSIPNAEIAVCVKDKTRMAVTIKTADGEWRGFYNADGLFTYSTKDAKRYVQHPIPDEEELTIEKLCGLAELRGLYFALDVWSGSNPAETLARNTVDVAVERVPDKPITTVTFNLMNPDGRITFTVDHERNWLKAVQSEVRPGRSVPLRFTEVVTAFEPTATDADVAFTPPANAERFEIPAPPGKYDRALRPGASPFAFRAKDMDGKPVSLDDYKGRVLLIDFWATWCGPCVAEIPTLRAVYEKYKAQGFEVLSISLDDEDTQAGVPAFIKKNKMTWRHICDGQGWETPIAQRYGVKAIPFTVLVGRDGKIAAVNIRGEALEPAVKAALAK